MYERNAIVLDRYFNKIFEFNENDNLKSNYSNYCELLEKLKIYNDATLAENEATEEFEKVSNEIKQIQKSRWKIV